MAKVCNIILICEGWRDSSFARGFLKEASVDARNVTPKVNQSGSGHDYVKRCFVEEVANTQHFKEGRGVLALIDEDGKGSTARQSEIIQKLEEKGLPTISASEGRCLLVPMRNLETWLYWITSHRTNRQVTIDETTDYKKTGPSGIERVENADCRPAGEYLHGLDHTRMPPSCPPMLTTALGQLREFLRAVKR